ncbi:TPA: toll/interleukin-1 receptor domain-containing protein [Serratia marcescens]
MPMAPHAGLMKAYRALVKEKHPTHADFWPLSHGVNFIYGIYKDTSIFALSDSGGNVGMGGGIRQLSEDMIGFEEITETNVDTVRGRLEKHFGIKENGAIFFINNVINPSIELEKAMRKHEGFMGLSPMKIFLSHKSLDKDIVREYKKTLETLGFEPWLDEDDMYAGLNLDRAIHQGFKDSCAAVFFITKNFKDDDYLGDEVDHAIREKRERKDGFSIITLVFDSVEVPEPLSKFLYKKPKNQLEGLRDIIKALPIKLGEVRKK